MSHKKVYGIYPVKSLQKLKEDLERDNIPSLDLEYEQLVQCDPMADWLGDIITGEAVLPEVKSLFKPAGMKPEIHEIKAEGRVVYVVSKKEFSEYIRRELKAIGRRIEDILRQKADKEDMVWDVKLAILEATIFYNLHNGGLYASYHLPDKYSFLTDKSIKFVAFPVLQDYHC